MAIGCLECRLPVLDARSAKRSKADAFRSERALLSDVERGRMVR